MNRIRYKSDKSVSFNKITAFCKEKTQHDVQFPNKSSIYGAEDSLFQGSEKGRRDLIPIMDLTLALCHSLVGSNKSFRSWASNNRIGLMQGGEGIVKALSTVSS